MKLEPPKASFVERKNKGFGTLFEVTYPSGWATQLANGTSIQNHDLIPANSYYDASVPSYRDFSVTFCSDKTGGEVNHESS